MSLLLRLALRTLVARPTLALLAVLLLALATSLVYGLYVSVDVLSSLRSSLLNELAIEVELADAGDSTQTSIAARLTQRSDVASIQSLSALDVLNEVEQDMGESLRDVLTENPFPPIIRVRLNSSSQPAIEAFQSEIERWPGVLHVVYPKELWQKFDNWISALRGRTGYVALAFAIGSWVLVGLSLRAMLRNRSGAWRLLLLLGLRPRELEVTQLLIELFLGLLGGLIASGVVFTAWTLAQWLLATPLPMPGAILAGSTVVAVLLAILAGVWAPRPAKEL